MDLSTFYALVSATCFTLVGLWWTVVERRPAWRSDPLRRRLAGGTYLSFLLPGLMSLIALERADRVAVGAFRRHRWAVAVLYGLVVVLGVAPELARGLGWTPLVVGAFLLVLLVVLAHGLTWEFMMEPDDDGDR